MTDFAVDKYAICYTMCVGPGIYVGYFSLHRPGAAMQDMGRHNLK